MGPRRRRTDHLPPAASLPTELEQRAQATCQALTAVGFEASAAMLVPMGAAGGDVVAAGGAIDRVMGLAGNTALVGAVDGRPLHMPDAVSDTRAVAIAAGDGPDARLVVVVADPLLSRREAEALAAWLAPARVIHPAGGGACASLARELAAEYEADVVVMALFASAGMLLNLHVRSGGLLRAWRVPVDTVWGEAARHGAAFMLGDLQMHPGAEALASLGLASAAIVGLENGRGIALGAIGVAARADLRIDVARHLLDRSIELGPRLMEVRSRSRVPDVDESGAVELVAFAQRVGCRRFAFYSRDGGHVRFMSAHAGDGSRLVSPPDPFEEQLVAWAAEKGVAVVSEDAAAVLVGDAVLYAQDPVKRPMDQLRLALQDLRESPYAGPSPAASPGDEPGAHAA